MSFDSSRRAFLSAGLLAPLAACASSEDTDTSSSRNDDRLIRLMSGEIRTFDPHVLTDLTSAQVAIDQFQGLTRFDAKGEVVPSLASGWEMSGDGLDYSFSMRPDLKFSDGEPITAATFARTYDRLYDEALASPHRIFADLMESMRADGDVVRIRLKAPYPALPALLAHPAFCAIPHHRIEKLGDEWTNERPMVASGPYRAKSWILNDHIEMERNPYWHGVPAPIATILWRPSEDSLSTMRTFLAGQADIADSFPAIRTEWLRKELDDPSGQIVRTEPYLGTYYFVFNVRKAPFDDLRLREALSMTVERKWLIEKVLRLDAQPAYSYVPPELSEPDKWQPEWRDWPRERRLKAARRLMAEAGFGPDRPLRFQLRFNSSADHRRIAAGAAEMWRPIGVEVELFNSEAALHFDAMQRGDYEVARSGWVADLPAPENFLENFLSNAEGRNYAGYANPQYDAAFQQALSFAEPAPRRRAMADAEQIMMRDWPVLPIYFYTNRALVSSRVQGWHENAMNSHPNYDLSLGNSDNLGAAT